MINQWSTALVPVWHVKSQIFAFQLLISSVFHILNIQIFKFQVCSNKFVETEIGPLKSEKLTTVATNIK